MVDKQKTARVMRQFIPKKAKLATTGGMDYNIPNHSGDNSAGSILKTPVNDTDIPNKKYVDDQITTELVAGLILVWSGTIATIPTGWVLCNGSNGTPDLRNTFIMGASTDDAGVAKGTICGSTEQTGGAPCHNHIMCDMCFNGHQHACGSYVYVDDYSGSYSYSAWDAMYYSEYECPQPDCTNSCTDDTFHYPPTYALAYIMKT